MGRLGQGWKPGRDRQTQHSEKATFIPVLRGAGEGGGERGPLPETLGSPGARGGGAMNQPKVMPVTNRLSSGRLELPAQAFPSFDWDTRVSGGARWNHSNQEPS